MLVIIMLATIDLNHQLRIRTVKIKNIWTDRVLPPEFPAIKTPIAQVMPELSLGIGLVAS